MSNSNEADEPFWHAVTIIGARYALVLVGLVVSAIIIEPRLTEARVDSEMRWQMRRHRATALSEIWPFMYEAKMASKSAGGLAMAIRKEPSLSRDQKIEHMRTFFMRQLDPLESQILKGIEELDRRQYWLGRESYAECHEYLLAQLLIFIPMLSLDQPAFDKTVARIETIESHIKYQMEHGTEQ